MIPLHCQFHEATIVRFERSESGMEFELDDVLVGRRRARCVIHVWPPLRFVAPQTLPHGNLMEAADGEVLTLVVSGNNLRLVVEWNDFASKKSFVRSYDVVGEAIELRET
jgi:hypothetical protein